MNDDLVRIPIQVSELQRPLESLRDTCPRCWRECAVGRLDTQTLPALICRVGNGTTSWITGYYRCGYEHLWFTSWSLTLD